MSFMIRYLDLRNPELTLCCKYLFSKRGRNDSKYAPDMWHDQDVYDEVNERLVVTSSPSRDRGQPC